MDRQLPHPERTHQIAHAPEIAQRERDTELLIQQLIDNDEDTRAAAPKSAFASCRKIARLAIIIMSP